MYMVSSKHSNPRQREIVVAAEHALDEHIWITTMIQKPGNIPKVLSIDNILWKLSPPFLSIELTHNITQSLLHKQVSDERKQIMPFHF